MIERKVLRIGNSIGLTLPAEILAQAGIREGDSVRIRVRDGVLELEPTHTAGQLLRKWPRIAPELRPDEIVRIIREERESH